MPDLIEKYFRQDLTEAEKKALEQELASSEEAAQRFGELAEKAYRRFGLPEPQWNGPDRLPHHAGPDYQAWFWVVALLAVIGGISFFVYEEFMGAGRNSSASLQAQPTPVLRSPLSDHPGKSGEKPAVVKQVPAIAQAPSAKLSSPQAYPMVPVAPSTPAPAMIMPKLTPVNVDQVPNQSFSSLSAQLHLSSDRAVVVHVLDGQGNELVPLFNGNLGPGTWSFDWNGLLKDGRLAPAGLYKIEVRAGSWTQVKEVIIPK